MPGYSDNRGKPAEVSVDLLFLDEDNPRLSSHDAKTQDEILEVLAREMSIDEIALSIAANGYYETERLLVIPRDSTPHQTYTVIEGNRRLAAVKVLVDSNKRRKTKTTDLPTLSTEQRQQLQILPVSIFEDRKQLWPYLGFRHINGPRQWDAYAKAEYVAMVHEKFNVPIDEITLRIGDRFSTVDRIYFGYRLIRQAEKAQVFNRNDRYHEKRFYFSHLYTAADQPQFRAFLGITDDRANAPEPVGKQSLPRLRELLLWIYGSRSEQKEPLVKTQNPDLNLLREAVGSENALAAIRQGSELRRASEIARGDDVVFRELLIASKDSLLEVGKFVILGYRGERDLLKTAEEIQTLADDLYGRMASFQRQPSRAEARRRGVAERHQ